MVEVGALPNMGGAWVVVVVVEGANWVDERGAEGLTNAISLVGC